MAIGLTSQGGRVDEFHLLAGAAATIIFYLMCEISGMYRNCRGVSIERELICAAISWAATIPALLALGVMTEYAHWVDRSFILMWFIVTLTLIAASRMGVRLLLCYLRSRGFNQRGFAIVGINDLGIELAKRIEQAPELGLRLVGFYDDRVDERLPTIPAMVGRKLGSIEGLLHSARAGA